MSMVTHSETFWQQMGGWPPMMSNFFRGANIFQNPPIVKHYNNGFPHGSFFISAKKIAQGICQIWQKWWYPKAAIISSWLALTPMSGKVSKIDPHGFFEFHPCCLDTISNKWRPVANWTLCREWGLLATTASLRIPQKQHMIACSQGDNFLIHRKRPIYENPPSLAGKKKHQMHPIQWNQNQLSNEYNYHPPPIIAHYFATTQASVISHILILGG